MLVLNAGVTPVMRPIGELTWEEFARPWEVDVRQAFEWTRAALALPLDPDSLVVLLSSGAALRGSPLSGGYAGAKSTVRFIARYAASAPGGIRFATVLPQLTPATDLGRVASDAYRVSPGPVLTPEAVGEHVASLLDSSEPYVELLSTPDGVRASS